MESARAENTIFHVLQQHHIQQKIQLEEQFRSEIKASQDEARAMIGEQRQQEKDELIAAHEKVSGFITENWLMCSIVDHEIFCVLFWQSIILDKN